SPTKIAGDEFFYEHVHFRFPGNYLMAMLVGSQIALTMPGIDPKTFQSRWPTLSDCAQQLSLTRWADYQVLREIQSRLNRPPFINQLNHLERDQKIHFELFGLRPGIQAQAFAGQNEAYRKAIQARPNDWMLHDQHGRFLEAFGQREEAAKAWRKVIDLMPHHFLARLQLGNLLNTPATAVEAERYFSEAIRIRPNIPEAVNGLGLALAYQGRSEAAFRQFEKALRMRPDFPEAYVNRGLALWREKHLTEALAQFEKALVLNSNLISAHVHAGKLLIEQGKTNEAQTHFAAATRLDPQLESTLPAGRSQTPERPR
ncbi:MAG: tetratricopeptide repeat protein, partial [Verrucomicrobiota bacterium]